MCSSSGGQNCITQPLVIITAVGIILTVFTDLLHLPIMLTLPHLPHYTDRIILAVSVKKFLNLFSDVQQRTGYKYFDGIKQTSIPVRFHLLMVYLAKVPIVNVTARRWKVQFHYPRLGGVEGGVVV